MTSNSSHREIHDWVEGLRAKFPLRRVIRIVKARVQKSSDDERRDLGRQLSWLLCFAGREPEALHVLDQLLELYPDDVLLATRKSWIYRLRDEPEDALKWIDVALGRARRSGFFRRDVLGQKARILLDLGRGDELSDVLEEIMSLQITKEIPDVGRERDFVDRSPPGFIRKDVLDRYNEFRPRQAGDRLSDEPPQYDWPTDAV